MQPTATTPVTPAAIALRYGILTGLVGIIFSFVLLMTNTDQSPLRWLSLLITGGSMVLAHGEFKRRNEGYMEYSQGLTIGTLLGAIAGVLNVIFNYLYMTYMDTAYLGRVMEHERAKMEAKGGMSDEQIDQAVQMMQKFMTPTWMLLFGVLGSLLFSFLLALLISAITKHTKSDFE